MITALKNNPAQRIDPDMKFNMAVDAIKRQQTVVDIAKRYGCSRTTVYEQQDKALAAANKSFQPDEDKVLFYIPVTTTFIRMVTLALWLICKSSYRDTIFFIRIVFNYSVSIGTVFNVIDEAAEKARKINQSYDLSGIKDSASDEVFHWGKPILATVDIPSRFCALLVCENLRDTDTWGTHLLDLVNQKYAPNTTLLDGAKGLVGGHKEVLPNTKIRLDHFHMIQDMKDCARFLKNEEASTITAALKLYSRVNKETEQEKKAILSVAWDKSLADIGILEETHKRFKLLVQWLQYDVLQLAGYQPKERAVMYDFIVTEMEKIAISHPHRINNIITSLKTRRKALLDVADALNEQFRKLAKKYHLSIKTIWSICYVARYDADSMKYNEKSYELETLIGEKYEEIEEAVLMILETTYRCSSIVENFNSRLRPYLDERKMVTQKHLGLIQFYLNHKPFMRSKHKRLVDKTPAEALTGKAHDSWLEMLDFSPWYNQAA